MSTEVLNQQTEIKDSLVAFHSSQGVELRGSVLRLNRHQIVFEIYNTATVLRMSEVLDGFKIFVSNQVLYSGKAVITNLINSGVALICEARLDEVWFNLNGQYSGISAVKLQEEFTGFFRQWQKHFLINREYRLFVSELHSFFYDLRLWLEHVELGVRSAPSADRLLLEQELAQQFGQNALPVFQTFAERFEALAGELNPESVPAHQAYMRRNLHPLVLCSPFVYRTVCKPLGYAGDYEMVNMMTRDALEGASLFAKIVNYCFVNQAPAEAHRNRINYLMDKLVDEGLRTARAKRGLRVLSIGCGPAVEVQRFMGRGELAANTTFDLVDFNDETIGYTRHAIEAARNQGGQNSSTVRLIKKSVQQIIKEAARSTGDQAGAYDLIYCAGLFDYLTDQVCRRITEVMFTWLAPGGLVLATNVVATNPQRHGMEHMLDWNLIYRTPDQLATLKPDRVSPDDARVRSDMTGVNIWLEIRKMNHG